MQEWHEPTPLLPTPTPPSAKPVPVNSNTPPNGTPSGTPNSTPSATPEKSNLTNGTPHVPPKPLPNTAKLPAKHHAQTPETPETPDPAILPFPTNQDAEDVFVAASRVLTQHKPEPASSKAASIATPEHAEVQVQHKDALLSVLARYFDPAHPASGRDPTALGPLFAQSEVAGYCDELVHNIVTGGTQVGREESVRASGVLKVLGEHVANLPEVLTRMYVLLLLFLIFAPFF